MITKKEKNELPENFSSGISLLLICCKKSSKWAVKLPSWGTPPLRRTKSLCSLASNKAGKYPGSYSNAIRSPRKVSAAFCNIPHSATSEKFSPYLWHWKEGTFQIIWKSFIRLLPAEEDGYPVCSIGCCCLSST